MRNKEIGNIASNKNAANIYSAKGNLFDLSGFLYNDGYPSNFIISGGVDGRERYEPLRGYIGSFIGKIPIIILYNGNPIIEGDMIDTWNQQGGGCPLWIVNGSNPVFEPFFGMAEMQVVRVYHNIANKLGFNSTPRLDRVINSHIRILRELNIPISLSGFYYLSSFHDIGEFHNNILALPNGNDIWAQLGASNDDEQLDLFRSITNRICNDAAYSGWNPTVNSNIGDINCLQAIRNNGILLLSIDDQQESVLYTYLVEELKAERNPFILITDSINLKDNDMTEYLIKSGNKNYYGAIGDNVADSIGEKDEDFKTLCGRMNCLILFKHGSSITASKFSEVIGNFDATKVEKQSGTNRGFFSFLPGETSNSTSYSVENRNRVMPEDIVGLQYGQAIVFDTPYDRIIKFN